MASDFQIFYKNTYENIPKNEVISLEIFSNISSIYTTALLKLEESTTKYFNTISTGLPFLINLEDDDTQTSIPMRVLSYTKIPKRTNTSNNWIEITLIHGFYFLNDLRSKAYRGSISSIITQALNENTIEGFIPIICTTDDRASVRYRIKESLPIFIKKICKYGFSKNLPSKLFMNTNNELKLVNIADLREENNIYIAYDPTVPIQASVPSNYKNIILDDYTILSNLSSSSSAELNKFTTLNFKTEGKSIKSWAIHNYELNSDQSYYESPSKIWYTNWNKNPSDALALFINDSFERNIQSYYSIAQSDYKIPCCIKTK